MKKALLLGSSYSAAPLLAEIKRRGIEVHVCGKHPGDPCHEYADDSHFLDYSETGSLLQLVTREKYDYLVPSCNDFSYLSGAAVAEKLEYPGFDTLATSELLHTKRAFREFTRSCDIPAPAWIETDDEPSGIAFPCIVKPDDAFSGRGMSRVDHAEYLPTALALARDQSRTGTAIVEEFIDGSLHSHSAFIKGGTIVMDFFVDEFCTVYPYQVDCSNHPSFLTEPVRDSVRQIMAKLASVLNLTDGLLHTQFIVRDSNVWIIECMRRAPGDLYGNLISYSTGVAYADLYVRPFIGEAIVIEGNPSEHDSERLFARHTLSTDTTTTLFSISHAVPSNSVKIVPLKNSGHVLNPAPFDKAAIMFAEFSSREQLKSLTPKLGSLVQTTCLQENDIA